MLQFFTKNFYLKQNLNCKINELTVSVSFSLEFPNQSITTCNLDRLPLPMVGIKRPRQVTCHSLKKMPLPPIKPLLSTQTPPANHTHNNQPSPTPSSSHLITPVTFTTATTTTSPSSSTPLPQTPKSQLSIPPVPPPRSKNHNVTMNSSNILNNGYRRFVMMDDDDDQSLSSHTTSSSSSNSTTNNTTTSGGGGGVSGGGKSSGVLLTSNQGSSVTLNDANHPSNVNLETMQYLTITSEGDEEEEMSVLDDDDILDSHGSLDMQDFTYLETGKFGSVSERKKSTCDLDSVDTLSNNSGSESSTPRTSITKLNLDQTKTREQCIELLAKSLPQLFNRYRFINYVKRDPSLKKARKRQELIKETVETERTYVQNIKSFLNLYYQPLIENRDHGKDVLKTQSDIQILFSNINQIHTINQTLLTDLENANPEVKQVVDPSQPSSATCQETESNHSVTSPTQPSSNSSNSVVDTPSITSPRGFVIKRKDDPFAVKNTNTMKSYRIYESIGKPFEHLVPFLKTYTTYINNHDRATELFENLKKKKKFKEFLSEVGKVLLLDDHKRL